MEHSVDISNIKFEPSRAVISLDTNHNVFLVRIKLDKNLKTDINIKYAQNNVVSDLLLFGVAKNAEGEAEILRLPTPSVSHLYITLSNPDVAITNIELLENKAVDTSNSYPKYFDKDLGENYILKNITVFTPPEGYSEYSIFTSKDGRDFQFLARKLSKNSCPDCGESYSANNIEARFVRVFIEYNSASPDAILNDVVIKGEKAGTPTLEPAEILIEDFNSSCYNCKISENDTYDELYGIVKRRLGETYINWFSFRLADNPIKNHTYDYFKIENNNGQILISGNTGVSIATGLNYYLKYYCKVNISHLGGWVKMPQDIVLPKESIFRETKSKIRYAYNYCTHSYTMAFWNEKQWRDELDWLALSGVNIVLDTTAQEEVWRRFLKSVGYPHSAIKNFIVGPAFYAWAYMANMWGLGGPVHDNWFKERCELARKNHLIMRKLGMMPIFKAYDGMIPVDILNYDKDVEIIAQGNWSGVQRPHMIKTTSPSFKKYAEKFYKAQKDVFGDITNFYSTDPFHEGGIMEDLSPCDVSFEILSSLLSSNPNGTWIIQSWQHNPSSELLKGLSRVKNGKNHALVLDLYAEKTPNYIDGHADNPNHGYSKEFDNTPWIFCMLNNFGGRMGLHGHMDNIAKGIPQTFNSCKCIAGIGITPEEKMNNPVLYDFFFETIWQENADTPLEEISLEDWISEYTIRRYGFESSSAVEAWKILLKTVYLSKFNNLGQGAPESIANARPALEIQAASTWGNAIIGYDKSQLEQAAKLLLCDYDILKHSAGYRYDAVTLIQQVLSNRVQDVHKNMANAFYEKNISDFYKFSDELLEIIDNMETVTSSNEYYLLGTWIENAKNLATNFDDFSKQLIEMNAKALITTWWSYLQAQQSGENDYSNRQWSGLIGDFYKKRWQRWIDERKKELNGEPFDDDINWFEWEWKWVRENKLYPTAPNKLDLAEFSKNLKL